MPTSRFDGFAGGHGSLWVVGDALGRTLWRVDPRTRRVVADDPAAVRSGRRDHRAREPSGFRDLLGDAVVRIDPEKNRIVGRVHVGRGARSVASGFGSLWVANSIDGTVSRIDPKTNQVVATITVGHEPGNIAVGPSGVWVTTTSSKPVNVAKGTIAIGVLSDCKGRYSSTRAATLAGTELALLERGGKRSGADLTDGVEGVSVDGHPIRLVFGCSDTTTASALSEARRLVDEIGVRVLIGPLGGNQTLALQDFARRRPGVAFVNGNSSAQLLRPAPNFFSFHADGAGWTAGLGTYAYRTLGWRHAILVADLEDDVFNWTQAAGFIAEFCSLGGKITKRIWVPKGTQDYSQVIGGLPPSGVDGFFFATYPTTIVAFAKAYPGLRGNISRNGDPGLVLGPRRPQATRGANARLRSEEEH